YVLSSSTQSPFRPPLRVFGFWLAASRVGRGAFLALSSWTKYAPLPLLPLWATYPEASRRRAPSMLVFVAAFCAATLLSFWILVLEPNPVHAARVFWDRTLGWQLG